MRLSLFILMLILSLGSWAVAPDKEPPGKAVYEQYCITCHEEGIASAPKFNNAEDWKSRLNKQSLDDLVNTATKGLNAMPKKGTCSECTDEDLKNAIQYMLPQP